LPQMGSIGSLAKMRALAVELVWSCRCSGVASLQDGVRVISERGDDLVWRPLGGTTWAPRQLCMFGSYRCR
jgi:hypothetical protein